MKITTKQMRLRKVDVDLTITSAGRLMRNIPEGLWHSLKRKSALTGKPFPAGSNVVMMMYEDDGGRKSGACHLEELPDVIRAVVERGELWTAANRESE